MSFTRPVPAYYFASAATNQVRGSLFQRPAMSNPNKQLFEYRGPRTPNYYNRFYNPNLCHICKTVDRDNLIRCDRCGLIAYCSQEHKAEHYMEHKEICAAIANVLEAEPQVYTCKFNNWQEWMRSRIYLIKSVTQKLQRTLELYTEQIIMWSKTCAVCYRQTELYTCQKCYCANYCNEHASVFHTKHDGGKCERLKLSLNLEINLTDTVYNLSYGFFSLVDEKTNIETMLQFFIEYVLVSKSDLDWNVVDYIMSDYLSVPLTIYSGLKRNSLLHFIQQEVVVIHLIDGLPMNERNLPPWEILLHLLPQIRELFIIRLSPKLLDDYDAYKLCKLCSRKSKKMTFVSVPTLYHDFEETHPRYKKPNMIISYHAELNKGDAWMRSIRTIFNKPYLFFLTYSTEDKARFGTFMMQTNLDKYVLPIFNGKNYFAGLTPIRHATTDDTIFCNDHLIIYKNHLIVNKNNKDCDNSKASTSYG